MALIKKGKRIIRGRGVEVNAQPRHRQFGRYLVHMPSLKKSILKVKYPSLAGHPDMRSTALSPELTTFLHDVITSGELNKRFFETLQKEDRDLFRKLCMKAEVDETLGLGLDTETQKQQNEKLKRYTLVAGEVKAGNNSPEVLQELKRFIIDFIDDGVVSKKQGHELLYELSCLSC